MSPLPAISPPPPRRLAAAISPLRERVEQAVLPGFGSTTHALDLLSRDRSLKARGAIFTRREVVDFLLDLCGYTTDRPLHELRLLEPAFGGGDFLLVAVDRLLRSWRTTANTSSIPFSSLASCIRAVELHRLTFEQTKTKLLGLLNQHKIAPTQAAILVDTWLICDDFLLTHLPHKFDVVVGNPPYVRQEYLPGTLLSEYRARYHTLYDRADLYVPFIERSLKELSSNGVLGFICTDRWMKNRYGSLLRKLIAEAFHLRAYIDMVDTPAFRSEVTTYPAITLITRKRSPNLATRIAHRPKLEPATLSKLARQLNSSLPAEAGSAVQVIESVASGGEPWVFESSPATAIIRRLEATLPLLEETGCKVGIGVATGADAAFIAPMSELTVEPSRKLPLVMTKDIESGTVQWRGLGVINPFSEEGGLVDLADYPLLKRFLETHKPQIEKRHCARKSPANWYRTIDRITPSLTATPKLLIPDIKGKAHVVYEGGKFYPHHNLYFVTSRKWDIRALQAVLLSSITQQLVSLYSTKMRGGFLRFQAQYLRRIRLPHWHDISEQTRSALIAAAKTQDRAACDSASYALYGLSPQEAAILSSPNA